MLRARLANIKKYPPPGGRLGRPMDPFAMDGDRQRRSRSILGWDQNESNVEGLLPQTALKLVGSLNTKRSPPCLNNS